MNLVTELLYENSRYNVNRIVRMVEENPDLIGKLVQLTLRKDFKIPARASWVLTHCYDTMPELVRPYLKELILATPEFLHTGTRRNILRILSFEEIPEESQVFLLDHCLQWLISKKEPIAVKAHAMGILSNLALKEPDLKNEIIPVLLDILPDASMGIRARARQVLKKMGEEYEF
jgi:hypothetical protein